LIWAARKGHEKIVEMLRAAGSKGWLCRQLFNPVVIFILPVTRFVTVLFTASPCPCLPRKSLRPWRMCHWSNVSLEQSLSSIECNGSLLSLVC